MRAGCPAHALDSIPPALRARSPPMGCTAPPASVIARCAGVAKPTVYAHGGSKEAVFLACVEAEVERMLSDLSEADLQTRSFPARARLTALAEAIIDHGRAHPAARTAASCNRPPYRLGGRIRR